LLLLCDFYRQRFYLDRRTEWGLHWRAVILHFAKWPYVLLALCDVILKRRIPYALTAKVNTDSRLHMVLWPHLSIALLLSGAWLFGMAFGNIKATSLHLWAAVMVVSSLSLAFSDFMRFPAPYDPRLAPRAQHGETERELDSVKMAAARSQIGD
jgi:hypothetical protein